MIQGMIMRYLTPVLATIFLTTVAYAGVQTYRASNLSQKVNTLEKEITDIRASQLLAEELQIQNTLLIAERDKLKDTLRNAKGFNDPLSADFIRIFDQLRGTENGTVGTP